MPQLLLASASPRRAELLQQIGVAFQTFPVDIDETPFVDESPEDYVARLALEKAQAGFTRASNTENIVLGSDTTVVVNGCILGKPENRDAGAVMLRQLSGVVHQVKTAVAIVSKEHQKVITVTTDVVFRVLSHDEINNYWQSGEPQDKAGGYAIQGLGAVFVKEIRGSYSAVVGLPLMETATLLGEMGIDVWQVS